MTEATIEAPAVSVSESSLGLHEELVLLLLDEDSGYFRQVPGWSLNCAVAGAALAELSMLGRIDADLEHLILVDSTPVGDPGLDLVLMQVAADTGTRTTQYWVEKMATRAEMLVGLILERLQGLRILEHHEGGFWSLSREAWRSKLFSTGDQLTAVQFTDTRIGNYIFGEQIPGPRDVIIIALANACDVLRFIFDIDDVAEQRIELLCRLDLIAQGITDAVEQNIADHVRTPAALAHEIPRLKLRKMLRNRSLRKGNTPAAMAEFAAELGPVMKLKLPFVKKPVYFLAGAKANKWVHRYGRNYLRTRDYFRDLEAAYDASGLIPALDGADHFRMRKVMRASYAHTALEERFDDVLGHAREHMSSWQVGDMFGCVDMCRRLVNSQLSPLLVSVDSMDLIDSLIVYKQRALATHVARVLPRFMLHTRRMRKHSKTIDVVVDRIQSTHTAAQRVGCPRDHADDLLSLHDSDPLFMPESNFRFALSAPMLTGIYVGDMMAFAMHSMISRPDLYERIQVEAEAIFAKGAITPEDLKSGAADVASRFMMEVLRLYPTITMSIRTVMNACVVEGYELPVGARLYIATTAAHYMDDVFANPTEFDIDRYLPGRDEHRTPGYAPFGLGTHACLGFRLAEMHMVMNLLLLAHHFQFEIRPERYRLAISAMPSASPSKKLKLLVTHKRHELA